MKKSQLDYFDEYGLLYVERKIRTENGILFRAQLDNWDNLSGFGYWDGWQKAIAATIISKNQFQSNPPEKGPHFSRDNMLGLYSLCKLHKMNLTLKRLPLMVWNNYKWYNPKHWHPNTWAVFLAFKYPVFKYNPLIYIMALFSLLKTDYKDTTGKNIWFLTLTILNIKWPLIMAQKRFNKKSYMAKHHYKLFEYSHKFYFSRGMKLNNSDNPLREQVELYYKVDRDY